MEALEGVAVGGEVSLSSPPRGRPAAGVAEGTGGKSSRVTKRRADGHRYVRPYPFESKLKAVKLYLEEGLPAELVAQECGISHCCLFDWVKQYRLHGEAGLKPKPHAHRTTNKLSAVKSKITAIKKNNPTFGVKRISVTCRIKTVMFCRTPIVVISGRCRAETV